VLKELQHRHDLDTAEVEDVVMGCVTPSGEQGSCIAKTAALVAGWDWKVPGVQLNRFCASGLEAVNLAAQKVRSGWEDLVVAGGIESMSRVPMGSDRGAWATDPQTSLDTAFIPQGISADLIATLEEFSREEIDAFKPDFIVMWGDDQYENFKEDIIPPFCVLAYENLNFKPFQRLRGRPNIWGEPAEKVFSQPGHHKAGRFLARGLLQEGIDMAYAYKPLHEDGLGHAFANTLLYLDLDRKGFATPVVPVAGARCG